MNARLIMIANKIAGVLSVLPMRLTKEINSESGYVYHATNENNLYDIIESGNIEPHEPWYGTDQETWPDGSTEKRIYFSRNAGIVWQFAPDHGKPVIIRTKDVDLITEKHTKDVYSKNPISISKLEYLGEDGNWYFL